MQFYGIVGLAYNLIKSYLTSRYQYVQFENVDSKLLEIKTGIPQGSILGPLFFSIYINDLVYSSNKFSYLMYADDTTLYFNLEDFPVINKEAAINSELNKGNKWLMLNKLTLNVDKSKCMIFHKRRKVNSIKLTINNQSIETVPQFSFLGILLDENLSWKNHINMVTNKLSRLIGVLHRLKYIFPLHILHTLYNSLFVPHINYGSLVWGTHIEQLEKVQKKAVRIITQSSYRAHSEPLLKSLNLLNVKDMFSMKLLKFLHKLAHNELPSYFNVYLPYLQKIVIQYSLRLNPLPVPPVAHVFAESCLIYQLVEMKNKITIEDNLIIQKIEEKSHSHHGFCIYVKNVMLKKYKYEGSLTICHTCGRP